MSLRSAGYRDEEVAKRWWQLFPLGKNKDKTPAVPTESELKMWMTPARSKQLRTRLSDISWWMRALAEPIARRSNIEDKCTGRFWEGRYKCQKLADETAILACSAYVDLNPVRAGVADAPEKSPYTSVYERVASEKAEQKEKTRAKIRRKRGGRIPAEFAPIMERIGLSGALWCDVVKRFGKIFKRVAGKPESLAQEAILRGRSGYRTGSSPLPSAG